MVAYLAIIRGLLTKVKKHFMATRLFSSSAVCLSKILLGLSLAVTSSFAADSPYPSIDYGQGEEAKLIKNGEYLTTMSDCVACHTNHKEEGKPFSGGLGLETPFGTIYAPNITPDEETGIGGWTDDEFIAAMQQGIAPDGRYYFPVFPYAHFNKMSRQDILDIKAYLDKLPPVHQVNKAPDMPAPFSWRPLQFFWRELFFHQVKGEWHPKTDQSEEWNRGEYIVQGPGHCGMCHTPINLMGAQLNQYAFKGGFVDGYHAPDISSSHLGSIDNAKIIRVFKEDERIEGGKIQGPMLEANHESLSFLKDEDLNSIASYIKSVESKKPPEVKHSTTVDESTGITVYNKFCVGCHVSGAGGAPKQGDNEAWAKRLEQGLDTLYAHAIEGYNSMPPKGGCSDCTDEEIIAATQYLAKSKGEAKKTKAKAPLALTISDGETIYNQKTCHLCHTTGVQGAPKLGDIEAWRHRIEQNMDILFKHAIEGINNMPEKGACLDCSDAEIIEATKYMVQESTDKGDFSLW